MTAAVGAIIVYGNVGGGDGDVDAYIGNDDHGDDGIDDGKIDDGHTRGDGRDYD